MKYIKKEIDFKYVSKTHNYIQKLLNFIEISIFQN